MRKLFHIILVLLSVLTVSCKRNPSWVIDRDDMENLLFDVYLSEALCRNSYPGYYTPEKKEALYNSVMEKHGITSRQLDTSLYWYGQNYDIYSKICEKVTERLKKEKTTAENLLEAFKKSIQEKDTVDIWNGNSLYTTLFSRDYHVFNFKIATDTSYRTTDRYELRMNVVGLAAKDSTNCSQMELKLRFKNDSVLFVRKNIEKNGLAILNLSSDSLMPKQISGYILLDPFPPAKDVKINNVQLLRIRKDNQGQNLLRENNNESAVLPVPEQRMPLRPGLKRNE